MSMVFSALHVLPEALDVNLSCPSIPRWLPSPARRAYLLISKDKTHGGEIKEAVPLGCYGDPHDRHAVNNQWN